MPKPAELAVELTKLAERIRKSAKSKLNEQNTKASLIEPVLRALGWDTEDIDEVAREYRLKSKDSPVDYGLLTRRTPRLFVEAKALNENLDDHRWANQIMGYASVAGVEWIVLTNGDEYQIYNALARVHVEKKRFRDCRVSENPAKAAEVLALLARDQLDEKRIDVLWKAQFVDRQVQEALRELFDGDNDLELVNAVLRRAQDLGADEVRESLRRCRAQFEFPERTVEEIATAKARKRVEHKTAVEPKAASEAPRKAPTLQTVTPMDLIRARLIKAPIELTRVYRGQTLVAELQPDGQVKVGGKLYDSLSTAGSVARGSVIGRDGEGNLPATNGWTFWKYRCADGELRLIDHARQQFAERSRVGVG
ncbi:MAG: type I restriction enzyme HsdR N-terminal domain-containing protein [Planctomycetota bacterium]|nr:type I restriction enzyme HsdR N-terminal domain-containing protein [Planctomycetota bacterium]